jgi:general secretion pathway protein G
MNARGRKNPARARRGFTLLELVIALAILAILVSMATPMLQVEAQRRKEAELRAALRELRTAIDRYRAAVDEGRVRRAADASGYPPTLDVLVSGVPDAKSPTGARIYFLRRVPRDPMVQDDTAGSPDWGLRSYASPPDNPQAGDDVFDVYSRSPRVGLNGVPYRLW